MAVIEWNPDDNLPPVEPIKVMFDDGMAEHAKRKYVGQTAAEYDERREESPKWKAEDRIVKSMLDDLPQGSWVLDIPCGTGRFIPFYISKGFQIRAADISSDMISEAQKKAGDYRSILFGLGDVRDLSKLYDKCVEAAVMCRLTRWLSPADCVLALRELQRVARSRIVFTARVRNHPHARPYEIFNAALNGWHITRDEHLVWEDWKDEDYRVIALEPDEKYVRWPAG